MRHAFRVVGRIVAGLFAMTVLAGLLVGLPWLLIAWIGWPLPHHIPTPAELTTTLTSPIDDETLLDILAVLAWLLWANFVRDVIAEILDTISDIADARRDPTRHRPRRSPGGPMRIAATVLVGAITAAILLDSARALTARTATSASSAPQGRPAAGTASATHRTSTPTVPIGPPVTVTRTSTVTFASTGTATTIPPAVTVDQTTPTTSQIPAWARNAPGGTYRVQPGDNLWDIAQQRLGDPNRWREINTASRYQPQPDGDQLTDPDLIRPGWILALPATTTRTSQPPAASPPAAPPAPPQHGAAAPPPPATDTPSPGDSSSPTQPGAAEPGAANHGDTAHTDIEHA